MSYKCTNCDWEGEERTSHAKGKLNKKCPKCGDEVKSMIMVKEKKSSIKDRVKDFVDDLKDDGKRNHSNDPKKKSPGRKKSKGKRGKK